MTRIGSTSILVLALAALAFPASALGGYSTVNSITGSGDQPAAHVSSDYNSVNSLVGTERSQPESSTTSLASSPNAILGADGQPQPSPVVAQVRDSNGFDWLDGAIGALAAGLISMTLAAARTVTRHRRATAESRA